MTKPAAAVVSVTNYEERMGIRFGFRRRRTRHLACPRYVAGKLCKQRSAPPNDHCGAHHGWFDHSYQWLTLDRHRVFTTEPYYNTINDQLIHDLGDGIEELDLSMTVFDRMDSMWYPGATVLIIVHPREWAPDQRMRAAYYRWIRDGEPPM